MADNTTDRKYPIEYKGFKIDRHPEYQHMLRVRAPDGTDFGMYSDDRNYTTAIDTHLDIESKMEISHKTRTEYEEAQRHT